MIKILYLYARKDKPLLHKSWIFNKLKRYEEALAMSEQALLLNPRFSTAYANKILALNGLGKHEEAKYLLELVQEPNQR